MSLPARKRNRGRSAKKPLPRRESAHWLGLLWALLWAILAACGTPTWAGGIHANLAWSPRGVRVVEVPPEGAAHEAGLEPDDRVLSVDGHPLAGLNQEQVHGLLMGEVGSYAELVLLRGEETLKLRIKRIPYERPGG